MNATEQTDLEKELANMSLADLIRDRQRLGDYLEEHEDDDAADERFDEVRDAIGDRLEDADFWTHDESGRPIWNEEAVETLTNGNGLSEDSEEWHIIFYYLDEIFDEAEAEYEECISTTYAPRDRNIKCKDLAAKLEPYGIKVRRDEEDKSYFLHYDTGLTEPILGQWDLLDKLAGRPIQELGQKKQRPILECASVFWRGRTDKFDYLKVDSDYNQRHGQITGADHIVKALQETCGELLHGEEAAALLIAQKNSTPYWMTRNIMQRTMMIMEEQHIERYMRGKMNEAA